MVVLAWSHWTSRHYCLVIFTAYVCACLGCPSNKFGFNCSMTCNCMNEGQCNRVRGCVCVNGWTGGDCSIGEYEVNYQFW